MKFFVNLLWTNLQSKTYITKFTKQHKLKNYKIVMKGFYPIFKRELLAYFRFPVAYVFIIIFLAANAGCTFFLGNFQRLLVSYSQKRSLWLYNPQFCLVSSSIIPFKDAGMYFCQVKPIVNSKVLKTVTKDVAT